MKEFFVGAEEIDPKETNKSVNKRFQMAGLIEERDQDAAGLWENITPSSHIVMEDKDLQRV
ncbi:hypothetical protein M1D69_04875 [Bacillus sp. PK3-037]|nr:hypothetical protein C2H92_11720 [Bacillus halotolerans]